MARTALMSFLQSLAAVHIEAERRGLPVEHVRAERALRRRDLLKGAGALAGAAVIARSRPAIASTEKPRIAIVGAGIAGLNAALSLHDAGYSSTIYEAASVVGGRMHSNARTWANGQVSEWCGELIDSGHTAIQGLAQRFGLPLDDLHAAEPAGSTETYYFDGKYYPYAQADKDFQPVLQVLNTQNTNAPFPTLYNSSTAAGRELDHTSVYAWIERFVPGGHGSTFGKLLDVAYNIEYGRDTKEQSSLNLVYLLVGPTNDLVLFGYSDERFHIRGGNDKLPKAIAASLPAGSVKTGYRLTELGKGSDGSFDLKFATSGGTESVTADRVVLTIPFSVLRTIDYSKAGFDSLKNTAITKLGYGTNAKLQLQFSSRIWDEAGHPWPRSFGSSYADTGYQNTWDVTRAQPGATGILVDYTGGSIGASFHPGGPYTDSSSSSVREYAAAFLRQIEPVYPGITRLYTGTATLSVPAIDPNLLGSYSCWLVGQYTSFSGYEGVRQGKIHFAGEHCSTSFQGFMEGGAEEGARAAGEILSDYQSGIFP
jgi:monoamine oxidase